MNYKPGIARLPNGETKGLNPLEMDKALLAEMGHEAMPPLKVIRAKCLDCSHTALEVSNCTATDCPNWPYRMGVNPFRAERSDAQKALDLKRAALMNAKRAKK